MVPVSISFHVSQAVTIGAMSPCARPRVGGVGADEGGEVLQPGEETGLGVGEVLGYCGYSLTGQMAARRPGAMSDLNEEAGRPSPRGR